MPRRATRSTSNPGPSAADVVSTVNRPAVKRPAKKATRPAKKSRSTSSQIPVQVVEAAATALTPDLLEQLVTKVADVVTQRLSGSSMGTNPTASVSLPGSSSPHPPDASILQQPVDHNILQEVQPTIDSLIEVAVGQSQEAIAGIRYGDTPSIPKTIFHSSSLEIDSRVNDRVKAKIWNNA